MDLVNRYIKVTRENEKEVLKALEKLGFTWGGFQLSGSLKKPTKYTPINDGWVCGDIYLEIPENKEISFMNGNKAYLMKGINEITLEELKSFLPNNTHKVIKKLKDLDGLENGSGLRVYWCEADKCLEIYFNSRFIDRVFKLDKTDVLKAMGFKFEYKPLRKLEEVIDEIRNLKSLPFVCGESNYFVVYNNGWHVGEFIYIDTLSTYMTKEQAQKYVDELNEIVGGK
ncbi:MAG: hypothetical protein ACRCX2_11340 [Paraclostridium sp.]